MQHGETNRNQARCSQIFATHLNQSGNRPKAPLLRCLSLPKCTWSWHLTWSPHSSFVTPYPRRLLHLGRGASFRIALCRRLVLLAPACRLCLHRLLRRPSTCLHLIQRVIVELDRLGYRLLLHLVVARLIVLGARLQRVVLWNTSRRATNPANQELHTRHGMCQRAQSRRRQIHSMRHIDSLYLME